MGKELKYPFGFIRDKEQITEARKFMKKVLGLN